MACKRSSIEIPDGYDYQTARLKELVPLQPGKYIIYRTDSTVFTNFGRTQEIHSYQEKQLVDTIITDNLGRPSYRIYRFLRDTAGLGPWHSAGTFYITIDSNNVEVVDDNMRIIKLITPVRPGTTWKGNHYLADKPYPQYSFNNDNGMSLWDFTMANTNESTFLNGVSLNGVTTVNVVNEKDLPDTFIVQGNKVQIPANITKAYITGSASVDTVPLSVATPTQSYISMAVYNQSNTVLKLNNISVPPGMDRTYEYVNNNWTFGDKDDRGNPKDTLTFGLPYASLNYGVDKYAKNIGLIYQELIMWDYQYDSRLMDGFKTGFGVKRTMIDHN